MGGSIKQAPEIRKAKKIWPDADRAIQAAMWARCQKLKLPTRIMTPAGQFPYRKNDGTTWAAIGRFDFINPKNDEPDKIICPVHTVPGGWQTGDPRTWPFYRLHLLQGKDRWYWFEGEGKADLAAHLGLDSTCTAHGAGNVKMTDWRSVSGVKELIIVPDHDVAGEKAAAECVRLAFAHDALIVCKIVRLPGLKDKEDFKEWVANEGGEESLDVREKFQELVDAASPVERPSGESAGQPGNADGLGTEHTSPNGGTVNGAEWTPPPEDIVEFPEPMRLAEHYLARRRTRDQQLTLRRYREEWWEFDRSGYRAIPDEVALVDIYQHVDHLWTPVRNPDTGEATDTYKKLIARTSTVGEVARAIPACGAIVDGDMPQWLDGRSSPRPTDVVAFRNGLLDTAAYCRGENALLPLTPLWFGGAACPYDFDPAATCPLWLEFLDQTLDSDAQSIALLQEWVGLNLVPDNHYERLMMLVGPPRGGKGTVLEVMGATLGEAQAATTSFTKLSSRFGLAPLVGRLAAILPDAHIGSNTDAKGALEVLKSITGNDPQAIDRKGINELPRVRLFCRFSIAVNELPKLPDEAGAIKTRLLLIHFRNSFAGKEDTTLKPRLKAEAPGVAVWALEGLKRLRAQGRFTLPDRSAAMIEAFEKIVSPILGFLDNCCELGGGDNPIWILKDNLYNGWSSWCKDRGLPEGSKADFGQSLINANKGISAAKRGSRGQQFGVYVGVRLCH